MAGRSVTAADRVAQLDKIEAQLTHAVFGALRQWTAAVSTRLLGSLTAAAGDGDSNGGLSPDPEIAVRMTALWLALVRDRVAPVTAGLITEVMTAELEHDAELLAEHGTTAEELLSQRAWQERFIAELPNRLADVPIETFNLLRTNLADGLSRGDSTSAIRDVMAETLSTDLGGTANDWRGRASLIARTETTRTLNGSLLQAWSLRNGAVGMSTFKQWVATGDGRTRPAHLEADGQVVPLDQPFYVMGENLDYPGDGAGSSANTANCVTGDSLVAWAGQDVLASTRRRYSGPLVELHTARGHILSVTPNHPVLTPDGYVPAGELRPGQQVVAADRPFGTEPQVPDGPARIEQFHAALRETGVEQRVVGRRVNFHGDGVEGEEVQVVGANRHLLGEGERGAVTDQLLVGVGDTEGALPAGGHAGLAIAGNDWRLGRSSAPASQIRGEGVGAALLDAESAHPEQVGLTPATDRQPEGDQAARDRPSTYADGPAHLQHALALGMSADQIVFVDRHSEWHGEVYNLSTSQHWYSANGIALHNCRCSLAESLDGESVSTAAPSIDATADTDTHDDGFTASGCVIPEPGLLAWAPTDSASALLAAISIPGVVRDRDAVLAAAGGNTTMTKASTWSGLLAPIGVNSGDRRRLAAGGTFTHRDLPLPVMYQLQTAAGHDGSVVVGRILAVTIGDGPEGPGIYGTGDFLVGDQFADNVAKAMELVTNGLGHVSVDLADVTAELVDADGNPVDEKKLMEAWENGQEVEVYDQFQTASLIGVTIVAKPAFAQAIISLDGAAPIERTPDAAALERAATAEAADGEDAEDSDSDVNLTDFDGTPIEVGDRVRAVVASDDGDSDDSDDEAAAKKDPKFDPDNDGDDDSTDSGDTDGDSVEGVVTAISVEDDEVTIQPDDASASPVVAKSADVSVLSKGDAGTDAPDSGDGGGVPPSPYSADNAEEQVASLQAAAGALPDFRPDPEAFASPQLSQLTPMTVGPVEAGGLRRVFGHVAGWKSCHIGFSRECVTPPREDDFAYFHIGEITLADGSNLAVGNLTLGGRHADVRAAYKDAVNHYDDSGAGVAVVRAYADEFGIAVAGVITPETNESQLGQLRRSGLSGDWRRIGGQLRLVGALAVNTGGFPVPRYGTDATGRILGLVAAGSVPQSMKVEESFEEVARRVFAQERQKEARRAEVAALVASAVTVANRSELDDLLAGLELG